MTKYPIDLGRNLSGGPNGPLSELKITPGDEADQYPDLHLEWEKPYDLPDEGTMIVRFKKTSESMQKGKGPKDPDRFTVGLDILEILDATPSAAAKKEELTTGDILDAYAKQTGA